MKKKLTAIILTIMILTMCLTIFTACNEKSFKSITKIKNYEDIDKIQIVYNVDKIDGAISGANVKTYTKEKDIFDIYLILSNAEYKEEEDIEKHEIPDFFVRIYIKDVSGYIEYQWDKRFVASDDFGGKLKEGKYSMIDAHLKLKDLEKIFFRN